MASLEIKNTNVKVKIGIIKASKLTDAMLQYKVMLEAHHSSSVTIVECSNGIPVFYSGVNTKRYSDGTRVLCICEGDNIDEVFIIGEIDDRNKKDTYSDKVFEGQNYLSSISDYSGLIGLGNSGRITMWNGSSSLIMTTKNLSLDIDGSNIISITKNGIQFNVSDNNFVLSEKSLLSSTNGIQLLSTGGPIEIGGENIFLSSGNLLKISAPNAVEIKTPIFNVSSGVFKFKSVAGKAFSPTSPSIDMSVLSGDIQIATADGDFDISVLSPRSVLPPTGLSNKITLTLGPSLTKSGMIQISPSDVTIGHYTLGVKQSSIVLDSSVLISNLTMEIDISSTGITIGSKTGTAEPALKGNKFNDLLSELIDEINKITVPTALGPSGTPLNQPKLEVIKGKLNSMGAHMSQHVKVT